MSVETGFYTLTIGLVMGDVVVGEASFFVAFDFLVGRFEVPNPMRDKGSCRQRYYCQVLCQGHVPDQCPSCRSLRKECMRQRQRGISGRVN